MARLPLIAAVLVAGFFALTLVFPLSTMGDPAFDIPMLRARWYGAFYVFVAHLAAFVGALVLAWRWRSLWALASAVLSLAAFAVFFVEEGRIIRYGDLILPHDLAMPLVFQSQLATFGLAAAAAVALWRAYARR